MCPLADSEKGVGKERGWEGESEGGEKERRIVAALAPYLAVCFLHSQFEAATRQGGGSWFASSEPEVCLV